jgi:hypothetical protein
MKLLGRVPVPVLATCCLFVVWSTLARAEPSGETHSSEIHLSPSAAFDRARSLFRSGSFEECVDSYAQLFSHGDDFPKDVTDETIEEGRVYYSACLLALGRNHEAEDQMSAAIDKNRQMSSPDPVIFPSQVLDLFFKVRRRFLDKIQEEQEKEKERAEAEKKRREEQQRREAARVAELERLARQEFLVHENRRWIAAVPFGVGQFQNGDDTLGTVFLATETLLLATTVTAVSIELDTHAQAGGERVDSRPFNEQLKVAHVVELAAGAAFFLTSGLGVLEAQLNFVPEQRLRARARKSPVPPASSFRLTPTVQSSRGGAVLGVVGRF